MSSLLRPWKRRVPHALAAVLLLAGSALAQTTVAVSGHALIPDGTAASSVKMRFELIGCSNGQARIDGVAIFSDYGKDFPVDAVTGAFSGVIYPNVAAVSTNGIDCNGTYGTTQYLVTVLLNNRPNGKSVSYVVGPGAFNLDTALAAVTDPAVVIPTAVVTTPQGGAEQDISGPLSATQFKCNGGSCTPAKLSASSTGSGSFVLDFAPILRGTEIDQGTIGGIAILSKRIDDFNPTGYFTLLRNNANSQDIYGVDVKGSILLRETSGQQNPPANMLKFYSDASTHLLKCLRSDGTDCNPAGGGGGGSVTNFSAGTLSPLFTTSVATPTTTPVLSFTLSNFAAHTFYGNNTGSSGAPGAVTIGAADLPSLSGDVTGAVNATVVGKVNGVTYSASPSTDTAPIVTAANTATYTSILNCGDSSHALAYSTSTHTFSCQAITGSAAAGGSNTQVQYNNGGSLGGITNMTSNGTDVTKLTAGAGPFDLSAATITKLRVAGGLTTSANGDCGYDSTAKAWHCWQNGADRLMIAATNLGSAGQPCLSNGDGSCTNADPITSGNQATATAQTITATGAKTGVAVTNIGQVLVTVSGTYAGVAFNFEATPDGTFTPAFPVQATQADAAAVATATGALPSNTTRAWFVDVAGFTQFRVNATAYTSGTANITITPVYFQFAPLTTAQIVGTPAVSIQANASVNETQLAGTAVDVNSGNKSNGTQRMVLATDQPQLTNALKVDGSAVTQPVAGNVASAATDSGNPVKIGGVFNTTQPTVTTGQRVDAQMTARGAQIVAPGVEGFAVTANAGTNLNTSALALDTTVAGLEVAQGSTTSGQKGALIQGAVTTAAPSYTTAQTSPLSLTPAGRLRIDGSGTTQPISGSVDQGNPNVGSPWLVRLTDGAVNTPIMDAPSRAAYQQITDGTNTGAVTAARTSPALANPAQVVGISPNNDGLPVNLLVTVQKTNNVSTGSVASLAKAFASNNIQGNSIIVVFANGNNANGTSQVTDSAGNTYTKAAGVANSTVFESEIYYAVNIAGGANTVTVTPGGANASIAMETYEISGMLARVTGQPDQTATGTGTSGTASTSAMSASGPNEIFFSGIGVGTAAQTITVGTNWTNDSGQQNPTTPAGLFSFVSMSQFVENMDAVTPSATFTSEPWAVAAATFRPVRLGVLGTVKLTDGTNKLAINGDNVNAAASNRVGALPAIAQSNLQAAATAGRDVALLTDLNRVQAVGPMPINFASYSASKTVTAAATPTDVFGLPGNATNTVVVTRAELTCVQTTAGIITATLLTRGTADSAGTSTNTTVGKMDRNNGAAVSVPLSYTANPTINDGSPTTIREYQLGAMAAATATPNDIAIYSASGALGQGIVLRGTAQVLYWNFGGATVAGLKCTSNVQWIETTGL